MSDEFFVRALLAGLAVALVSAPLGCFVVWRRMAYFGEALAHAGLLGVALGLLLDLTPTWGILATCVAMALLLFSLQRRTTLAIDTLLGILSHAALACGLVALSLMEHVRVDLLGYLFGDILSVSRTHLAWIGAVGTVTLLALLRLWRPLLAITVHPDLAAAEGIPVERVKLQFMLLIALVTAMAMKVVGILLITSLLVIPAAAARRFARSPEAMAVGAALVGAAAVVIGLAASLRWDTPSGPSIVVAAAALFFLSQLVALAVPSRG